MKCLVVLCAVVAVSSAQFRRFGQQPAPAQPYRPVRASALSSDKDAQIVSQTSEIGPEGDYKFSFETSNGISGQQEGTPVNQGGNPPEIALVAKGAYSYKSPEGEDISLTFVADQNGFQPQGQHLPTSPPIPFAIQRSLEYIAKTAPSNKL